MNIDHQIEDLKQEEEKEETKDYRRYVFYLIIFLLLLFFSTFGLTYSIYKGNSENEIITDKVIFTYSDVNKSGSGISITNALPISDERGKMLMGANQYFDFSTTATSTNTDINYKVLVRKNSTSSLSDNKVRIYLTKVSGSLEEELVLDTVSNLKTEEINGIKYYVLYEKSLTKGIKDYTDAYRLRMWVKEDAIEYDMQVFSINVDIQAEGGK